jgi:hypothetical protein
MRRLDWRFQAALLLGLVACPSETPRDAPDAAASRAGVVDVGPVAAAVERMDAGPAAPRRLEFAVSALVDGGVAELIFTDAVSQVEPISGLSLATSVRLRDYRVRLFDWADQVVVSDDTAELTDAGLVYRIALPSPLRSGRRYSLLIDAQHGPKIADEAGHHYDDVRLTLEVRGEVLPDRSAKAKPGKKPKKK